MRVVAVATWAIPLRWWPERALEWLDAVGLSAYAVYGAGKAMHFGIPPIPAATAGVVTACVGGIVRDITANVPSILMRHELYVTAALCSAALFVALATHGVARPWPVVLGFASGFLVRAATLRWKLALPPHRGH